MLALPTLAVLLPLGDVPFSRTDFDAALADARRDDKIVVLGFTEGYGDDSYTEMIATVFQDANLRAWFEEHAVTVRPEFVTSMRLLSRYLLGAHPTHLLLDADGYEIDRIEGRVDAERFLFLAQEALDGRGMVWRARQELEGREEDHSERLRFGRVLVRGGKFAEALEQFLWCFDHPDEDRPFAGVRRTYLMGELRELGALYPPTRDAVAERRDPLGERILAGASEYAVLADYAALNEALGEERSTLAMFDTLVAREGTDPEALWTLGAKVEDLLLQDRRYDDVHRWVRLTLESFRVEVTEFEERIAAFYASPEDHPLRNVKQHRLRCVGEGLDVYEVLLGLKLDREAREASRLLLELSDERNTYYAQVLRALRAGRLGEARRVRDLGLQELSEKDREWLRRRLRRKLPEETESTREE